MQANYGKMVMVTVVRRTWESEKVQFKKNLVLC